MGGSWVKQVELDEVMQVYSVTRARTRLEKFFKTYIRVKALETLNFKMQSFIPEKVLNYSKMPLNSASKQHPGVSRRVS